MSEVNWKLKYTELKSKYMSAVDTAFRLGVEEGMKQAQVDQANQQMADAQAQQEAMMGGGGDPAAQEAPGQNNNGAMGDPSQGDVDKSGAPSVQATPVSENPGGSELDQHIAKLESMIAKSEELDVTDLKKTVNDIKSLQKSFKEQLELKKSAQAIPAIARALHKPQFKFGVQANHNLSSTAKATATMQHKIVSDIMQKMADEEQRASKDILSTLNVEGIVKGE